MKPRLRLIVPLLRLCLRVLVPLLYPRLRFCNSLRDRPRDSCRDSLRDRLRNLCTPLVGGLCLHLHRRRTESRQPGASQTRSRFQFKPWADGR
jgi:hypothetical protein